MPIVDGNASKAAEWEKYIVSRWAKVVLEMLEEGDPDVSALFASLNGSVIRSSYDFTLTGGESLGG